jgi:hypothetical protein
MKPAMIVAIALAFAVNFAPRSEAQKSSNKAAQKRTQESKPSSVTFVDNHWCEAQQQPAQDNTPKWYQSPEWILVIVGIITFLVVGYQSWATKRAAVATESYVEAVKEQTPLFRQSAEAALGNATAVIDSERAWIVADPETPPPFEKDHITRLVCRLRNVGKTPARIMEVAERVFVANEKCPLPENPEYLPQNIHRSSPKGGALMAPNVTMTRLLNVYPSEMGQVERGESILYVYGYVIYRDVFSQQEHRTDYGFIFNTPNTPMGGGDPVTRMFFMSDLPGYNEAT